MKRYLKSEFELEKFHASIGHMLYRNCEKFADKPVFSEPVEGVYQSRTWAEFGNHLSDFSQTLVDLGFSQGDRIAFITANSYLRLVGELAVMSSSMVSVPIFVAYNGKFLTELLEFSEVSLLVIENLEKLESLDLKVLPETTIVLQYGTPSKEIAQATKILWMEDLLTTEEPGHFQKKRFPLSSNSDQTDEIALVMYTSGTTSFPKGVMLTHGNIISQQKSLEQEWKCEPGLRILSYLPWHHSFGGIFERFFALYSGGCLSIDDSRGRDIDQLIRNFAEIKPQIYFSVPKVYSDIVTRTMTSKEAEKIFFHDELKFVFTAAAPLTLNISNVFKERKIPVVEAWGLTETSPSCTVTPLSLSRQPGVVGFPHAGIEIKLGDENEILVKGPNVMKGYFKRPEATSKVLSEEGWFKTGDVGEITDQGVKIISRKDRMFKLDNGEKLFPSVIEDKALTECIFMKHIYLFGRGQKAPYALVFPNKELLNAKNVKNKDRDDCVCPNSFEEFSRCLGRCFHMLNQKNEKKYERVEKAILLDEELSLDKGELTPSMKMVPRKVDQNYKALISCMEENNFKQLSKNGKVIEIGP